MNRRILVISVVTAAGLVMPAAAAPQEIQPGAPISTGPGTICSMNWIFDGPDGVFAGTAAHCVDGVGQEVSLAEGPLNDPIERIGEVAFRGDVDAAGRDYAFIRIDSEDLGQVNPAMKGHPDIPAGVSTGYRKDDLMQFSGHGLAVNLTAPTREKRVGILNRFDTSEHEIIGPVIQGDSGSPVADLTRGNTAFGIVTEFVVGINPDTLELTAGERGENLDFVLEDAAAHGFPVTLRTVP